MRAKKHVLSLAGFDPSAGAGVLSDIKTFEAHNVNGIAACTCITYQNEQEITGLKWFSANEIIEQLKPLFTAYQIDHVKIGLIQNSKTLKTVIDYLIHENAEIKIIWDPILQSSSGFEFNGEFESGHLSKLCDRLFLITPNLKEIKRLIPDMTEEDASRYLSGFCPVLLKGGHSGKAVCTDQLFTNGNMKEFDTQRLNSDKHGTGCVLSSAITANLANGMSLDTACEKAKHYVFNFLQSDPGLIGQHSYSNGKVYS